MWLVASPRSQFSRVTCLTHPGGSATSGWSELPHNSRPLTFGNVACPSLPFAVGPQVRRFAPSLDTSDWDSGSCVFSFWSTFLFFFRFLAFFTHPPKNFGNLCSSVGLVLRSCFRDLHVLHLTFVSKLCCAVTGTIFICLTPVCWVHCLRAAVLSPKKGPRSLVVISASSGTSLCPSPPHLLSSIFSATFISHYPFIAISLFSIYLYLDISLVDISSQHFFDIISSHIHYHHKWRRQ